MVEKSEENTNMNGINVIEELSKPGGSIEYIGEDERNQIKNLPLPEKDEIRKMGEKVISAKILEIDNLIIEAAVKNLKNSLYSLAKYARNLLDEQKKQFMRLTANEESIVSPINLNFFGKKNIKVEIKNTQINNSRKKKFQKVWQTMFGELLQGIKP